MLGDDGTVAFLARGVPNVHLGLLAGRQFNGFDGEFDADGGVAELGKFLTDVAGL